MNIFKTKSYYKFSRNPLSVIGLVIVTFVVLITLFAPYITPFPEHVGPLPILQTSLNLQVGKIFLELIISEEIYSPELFLVIEYH